MGSLDRRLVALEDVAAASLEQQAPHRTEAGRKLISWLDGYSARKRAGTLTAQDELEAEEIREALKRRRQELNRGGVR